MRVSLRFPLLLGNETQKSKTVACHAVALKTGEEERSLNGWIAMTSPNHNLECQNAKCLVGWGGESV